MRVSEELLLEAVAFAARAHEGQYRRDKQTPYISHPYRVSLILRQFYGISDEETLAAAMLHDVIEDTPYGFQDLAKRFGSKVATWVRILSKDHKLKGEPRELRYQKQLAKAPEPVKWVKLADMTDNLLDSCDCGDTKKMAKTVRRTRSYFAVMNIAKKPKFKKAADYFLKLSNRVAEQAEKS